IRAVIEVESGGGWFTDMRADILNLDGPGGFIDGDMPKILFEALWFHRLTNGRFTASHPKISSNKWDKSLYVGGQNEYRRLHEAMLLDELAALKSASWGMFQIMGFNHQLAGYSLVTDFVVAMKKSEANHLAAFLSFITNSSYQGSKLIDLLRKNDFNGFAGGYNGEGQIALYGGKLSAAFKKYS
ncbi:N-acetylmuramidase family protein, partial [Parvimonas sp. M13]